MYINERIMNVQVSNYGSSSPRVAAATTNCNHSIRRVHTHSAYLLVFVRTKISGSVWSAYYARPLDRYTRENMKYADEWPHTPPRGSTRFVDDTSEKMFYYYLVNFFRDNTILA